MIEIQRPVFVSGENPGLTLYVPGTDQIVAVASYWHCVVSPWGLGHALILWLAPGTATAKGISGGIFTDNLDLAQGLVNTLIQHFPEFQGIPLTQLNYHEAACEHTYDGNKYQVTCKTADTRMELEWSNILDRKQVLWGQFPAGPEMYDLTTVICPCGEGQVRLDGVLINGKVQTAQTKEGAPTSSAFLAFSETWIGPLAKNEGGQEKA